MTINRIFVGMDGSPAAQAAIRWAADLAADVGAEVVAVVVLDTSTEFRITA